MTNSTAAPPLSPAQELALAELRHLVLAAQREGNRWLADALRPIGLTPSQAEILTVLAQSDGLTLVELGRSIVCETGSPSRLVDHLVRRDLVHRQPGTHDRRVVHLRISEAGLELARSVGEAESVLNDLLCRQLPAAEREALAASLRKIIQGTRSDEVLRRRFPNARASSG